MNNIDFDKVQQALFLLSTGATTTEMVEEYIQNDSDLILKSKKITTKNLAPDISAIKILLSMTGDTYGEMTPEELEEEKQKLIKLLGLSNPISQQKQ